MGWESSDVRFDLWPLLQSQMIWFTGFGELSFWWIQICIGSPMRRSSYICLYLGHALQKNGYFAFYYKFNTLYLTNSAS